MPTSNEPPAPGEIAVPVREQVRLRMAARPGANRLDGGWWPRSRDLTVELAELIDQFPHHLGRIVRAQVAQSGWGPAPRRVRVAGRHRDVDVLAGGESDAIDLTTSDETRLHVLVIPPDFTEYQGEEALLAAATDGNAHSACELLEEVTQYPEVDPAGYWAAHGVDPADTSRPRSATAAGGRHALPGLLACVVAARLNEAAARHEGLSPGAMETARRATLDALLDYARTIDSLCWPIPRTIQLEIRLHRILVRPSFDPLGDVRSPRS